MKSITTRTIAARSQTGCKPPAVIARVQGVRAAIARVSLADHARRLPEGNLGRLWDTGAFVDEANKAVPVSDVFFVKTAAYPK
jgi:hypothetical protein